VGGGFRLYVDEDLEVVTYKYSLKISRCDALKSDLPVMA
jgi:hypothetical protein